MKVSGFRVAALGSTDDIFSRLATPTELCLNLEPGRFKSFNGTRYETPNRRLLPRKGLFKRKGMQVICPLGERASLDSGPRGHPLKWVLFADADNLLRHFRELLLEQLNLFDLVVCPLATVSKRNNLVVLIEVAQGHA
ncbi:hypothetical protein DP43_2416 [Burkholderia pseudomallei]|nr:hypothetical protein DP43_2416 [Burkholderia pseudomallei]